MSTIGINFRNLGYLLNGIAKKENSIKPKAQISLQDLEHISDALLVYTRHLSKKKNFDKMNEVKELDKRIFQLLEDFVPYENPTEELLATEN